VGNGLRVCPTSKGEARQGEAAMLAALPHPPIGVWGVARHGIFGQFHAPVQQMILESNVVFSSIGFGTSDPKRHPADLDMLCGNS
jgi:hypothetical protein